MILNGVDGEVISLDNISNQMFVFQNDRISRINYNQRVQVSTSDGIPVEITNSTAVDGAITIANGVGLKNKWSKYNTGTVCYFVDDDRHSFDSIDV